MSPPSIWDNWPTSSRDKMMGMYPSVLRKKDITEQEARREEGGRGRERGMVWRRKR